MTGSNIKVLFLRPARTVVTTAAHVGDVTQAHAKKRVHQPIVGFGTGPVLSQASPQTTF